MATLTTAVRRTYATAWRTALTRFAILLPLLLAACGSSERALDQAEVEATSNASVDVIEQKVAAATKGGNFVSPGRWEGTVRIVDMKIPGMTPAVQEKVRAQMAKTPPFTNCLTPEEAKQPRGKFFGGDQNGACTYDNFRMTSGTIDAAMTCGAAGGGPARKMVMKGKYSPDSYEMTVTSTGTGDGPGANMAMTMAMQANRTGECRGDEGAGVK